VQWRHAMKIETNATVVGVGRYGDSSSHEVELEAGGRPLKLKVDKATARGFAAKLYQDVRLTVDSGPEDDSPNAGEGEAHERLVRKPYRVAKEGRPVFAVGATSEDAIRAYAAAMGWGVVENIAELASGDPSFTWGCTFTAGGTGFKAAGWDVPGGVVLTWWK